MNELASPPREWATAEKPILAGLTTSADDVEQDNPCNDNLFRLVNL